LQIEIEIAEKSKEAKVKYPTALMHIYLSKVRRKKYLQTETDYNVWMVASNKSNFTHFDTLQQLKIRLLIVDLQLLYNENDC